MIEHYESDQFYSLRKDSQSVIDRPLYWTNGSLSVWIPTWYCCGGVQHIIIRDCVYLTKIENLGSEYPRYSRETICWLDPFPVEGGYLSVESCRSRQLLGSLASPASNFFSRPWLHQIFHQQGRSSCWNSLEFTRKFFRWPWRGYPWIPWPKWPCTTSWTPPTEWSFQHRSSRVVLANISWVGLRL